MKNWTQSELIFFSTETKVFRVYDQELGRSLIVKTMTKEHPTSWELDHFHHEFEILLSQRDIQGVILPFEKTLYEGRHAIAFFDTGGRSLESFKNWPLNLEKFFAFAIETVKILNEIHSRGVIHKDLNPNNIIALPDFSKFWIIDFSISTRIKREVQTIQPVQDLEGTLAYLSPEQSGRINRALDYRTDFYSLGITFYEILTGEKPFQATDLVELLHAHLTTPLPDLTLKRRDLPVFLVKLIEKLTAKDPDNRYQSALGLLKDLKKAEDLWKVGELTECPALGQDDLSERFIIPEKVYGRYEEVGVLIQAFEGSLYPSKSHRPLVLIGGEAGVGKSSLIRELLGPVSNKGGYLLEGKVDQFQRSVILHALKEVFLSFFTLLAGESPQTLAKVQADLAGSPEGTSGVITEIIPELTPYLGVHPKPHGLSPEETRNRLHRAFQSLLQTISKYRCLVLFIDDLQWADPTTLGLLEYLATASLERVLLIGAYRSNEVGSEHPLTIMVQRLNQQVTKIELKVLGESVVQSFLGDALGNFEGIVPIGLEFIRKTGGNPFFVHQLLRKLYAEEILTRDLAKRAWKIDLDQLKSLKVSENIVEFLLEKLHTLDHNSQNLLGFAAALGTQFDMLLLSKAIRRHPDTLVQPLMEAVELEIIRPLSGNYSLLISSQRANPENAVSFQFVHDRLQQACYELLSKLRRKEAHMAFGDLLARMPDMDPIATAEQYLKVGPVSLEFGRRMPIAEVFLHAALRAKDASAFREALVYIAHIEPLIQKSEEDLAWKVNRKWMRKFYLSYLDISFRAGQTALAKKVSEILLERSPEGFEKAEVLSKMTAQEENNKNYDRAIELGIKALKCLDLNIEENISLFQVGKIIFQMVRRVNQIRAQGNGLMPLLEMKELSDPTVLLIVETLSNISIPAYFRKKRPLVFWITLKIIELNLDYGLCPEILDGFSGFVILCGIFDAHKLSRDVFEVGLKLSSHPAIAKAVARRNDSYFRILLFCAHLHVRRKDACRLFRECFEECYHARVVNGLFSATYLMELEGPAIALGTLPDYQHYFKRLMELRFEMGGIGFKSRWLFLSALNARSTEEFNKANDELRMYRDKALQAGHLPTATGVKNSLAVLEYLFFGPAEAIKLFKEASQTAGAAIGLRLMIIFRMFHALCVLGYRKSKTGVARILTPGERVLIFSVRRKLRKLAEHNPHNFTALSCLVEGEVLALKKAPIPQISSMFERAVRFSQEDGDHFTEALAFEKLAEACFAAGQEEAGNASIQKAFLVYQKWEAWAKCRQLSEKYSCLSESSLSPVDQVEKPGAETSQTLIQPRTSVVSRTSRRAVVDFREILRLSRSISGEVVLSKLTDRVLQIASEMSGAEFGILFMPGKGDEFVPCGTIGAKGKGKRETKSSPSGLPKSIVARVNSTQGPVILDDASKDPLLMQDPYFLEQGIRSVCCIPTINQGRVIAVLYLENNSIAGAFTKERIDTLDVLTSQAAVSIENARLYQALEERVSEKGREVEAILENIKQGICSLGPDFMIGDEYSQHLEAIVESRRLRGLNAIELLFNHPSVAPNKKQELALALKKVFDLPAWNFAENAHLLPKDVVRLSSEGKDQYLELDWKPLLNAQSRVHRILVGVRDVTELKVLRKQAQENKADWERMSEILGSANEALRLIDQSLLQIRSGDPLEKLRPRMTQDLEQARATLDKLATHLSDAA